MVRSYTLYLLFVIIAFRFCLFKLFLGILIDFIADDSFLILDAEKAPSLVI